MEQWKPIPGYDGRYEVSTMGRVRSFANGRWGNRENPHILKPKKNGAGYHSVCLHKQEGKREYRMIHRLVALAFIPNENAKPEVNHKDGDKANNKVSNLEWATGSENVEHSFSTGLHIPSEHQKQVASKICAQPVIATGRNGENEKRYESATVASRETEVDTSQIIKCCKGKAKTAGGYKWRYDNYATRKERAAMYNLGGFETSGK